MRFLQLPSWVTLLLLILLTSNTVLAEIIELDILIDASSDEVHFVQGYLKAPASVDLSGVRFVTAEDPEFTYGDDEFDEGDAEDDRYDDSVPGNGDGLETEFPTVAVTAGPTPRPTAHKKPTAPPTPTPVPKSNGTDASVVSDAPTTPPTPGPDSPTDSPTNVKGGGNRELVRLLAKEATKEPTSQILDIVLFQIPSDCKKDAWGTCNWAVVGVGAYDEEMEGGMSYCCTEDTASRGICHESNIGTLIVDHDLLTGDHRKIEVPNTPDEEFVMEKPAFEVTDSGDYVMVIANCDDYGMEVLALGNMEWKSVGGYLPGDMFGLMFFYAALACIYFALALWYYCGMKMFQDAAIPIQKYIFATMILGLFEVLFRTADLFVWNLKGFRSDALMYPALVLGILKLGSSRCLTVMVSMGWGVVRDSLGSTLVKIVLLGLLYSGLALARDFLVVAAESVKTVSTTEEEELYDLALVLTPLILVVNLIFYVWIISSLNATTDYLRNMNQTSKLKRHLRLRCLIITSLVVVGIWWTLYIVQALIGYLSQDQIWIMDAVLHANYFFLLFGVAVLWQPTSTSKDYAMQMEVPSLGNDDNELELSCVVPSADDMDYDDGNDPDHPNGLRINGAVAS